MTTQLHNTTLELRDRLRSQGVALPFALKRRDPKEPGRKQKEATEVAIYNAYRRYFAKQKRAIRDELKLLAPHRKVIVDDLDYYLDQFGDEFWEDEEFIANMGRILATGSASGINIFAEAIDLQIDYTLVNEAAAQWALEFAGTEVKLINDSTLKVLRSVLSDFVETPGMTIGDIVKRLPYKDSRSLLIAISETTDIYGEAALKAGLQLQTEYPDVLVIKHWYTNMDDKVCPICAPMEGQEVPVGEPFIGGDGEQYERPKAHIGGMCWMSTSTKIGAEWD